MRRAFSISFRIMRSLRHDRRAVAMIVIAPIVAMFVFGIAFGGDVKDVRVMLVDEDEGLVLPDLNLTLSLSKEVVSRIDKEVIRLEDVQDLNAGLREVEDGRAWAVLFFPRNFTVNTMLAVSQGGESARVYLYEDKSNVNVASKITQQIMLAMQEAMGERIGKNPVVIDDSNAVYGGNATFMDFFVPGVTVFAIFMLTTLLTLLSFVNERRSGTLQRLMVTPLTATELVLGYALAFGLLGVSQAALLLTIGIAVFRVSIVGSVLLAFLVAALLATDSQALGILLSAAAKTETQAVQFLPLIVLPTFLLAGIFWPVEAIPAFLRPASYLIPPTYAVNGLRSVMLRGWSIDRIWPEVLILSLFAVFFLLVAIVSIRRESGHRHAIRARPLYRGRE